MAKLNIFQTSILYALKLIGAANIQTEGRVITCEYLGKSHRMIFTMNPAEPGEVFSTIDALTLIGAMQESTTVDSDPFVESPMLEIAA